MSKITRLQNRISDRVSRDPLFERKMKWGAMGNLVRGITTPSSISPEILDFCKKISPGKEPEYVLVQPPLWSRRSCCSINTKKMVEEKGGSIIWGYKIWSNEVYAEGEPHCIWLNPDSSKIDITFNQDGEMRILFIEVPGMNSTKLSNAGEKPRHAIDPDFSDLIELEIAHSKNNEFVWMPEEESWQKQLTYEQWLAGKR